MDQAFLSAMEILDEVMTNQDSEEGKQAKPPSAKEMDRSRMDYAFFC